MSWKVKGWGENRLPSRGILDLPELFTVSGEMEVSREFARNPLCLFPDYWAAAEN